MHFGYLKVLCVALTLLVVVEAKVIPFDYPLYKQCDKSWADDVMVNKTICQVGCLMSSVSMALHGHAVPVGGQQSDPHVLNAWLRDNGGYDDDNDLKEIVVEKVGGDVAYLGPKYGETSLSPEELKALLLGHVVVIGNVMNGRHFVLLTGYDTDLAAFYVNDPGFDTLAYKYSDFVGYRLFVMTSE